MRNLRTVSLLACAVLMPLVSSGCIQLFSMGIFTPIPVPPWVPDRVEERLCNRSDYDTPILPPIPAGYRPLCEDPPDRQTILRAMPRVVRGVCGQGTRSRSRRQLQHPIHDAARGIPPREALHRPAHGLETRPIVEQLTHLAGEPGPPSLMRHCRSGAPLRVAFVDDEGRLVEPGDVQVVRGPSASARAAPAA